MIIGGDKLDEQDEPDVRGCKALWERKLFNPSILIILIIILVFYLGSRLLEAVSCVTMSTTRRWSSASQLQRIPLGSWQTMFFEVYFGPILDPMVWHLITRIGGMMLNIMGMMMILRFKLTWLHSLAIISWRRWTSPLPTSSSCLFSLNKNIMMLRVMMIGSPGKEWWSNLHSLQVQRNPQVWRRLSCCRWSMWWPWSYCSW